MIILESLRNSFLYPYYSAWELRASTKAFHRSLFCAVCLALCSTGPVLEGWFFSRSSSNSSILTPTLTFNSHYILPLTRPPFPLSLSYTIYTLALPPTTSCQPYLVLSLRLALYIQHALFRFAILPSSIDRCNLHFKGLLCYIRPILCSLEVNARSEFGSLCGSIA